MDAVTKRLHIGGLTPTFSADALRDKLAQYGEVLALEGCTDDYVDAVGQRRPYAFATMRATPAQFAKCMNTLSGAIWKGAKLRIGEAKPSFAERLAKRREKEAAAEAAAELRAAERHKRWLRKRPWIGVQLQDMRPVSRKQVEAGTWGWKVTPAGHMVRPMHMRPERPLPLLPDRPRKRTKAPPARAYRVTIDPTRYKPEHLAGSLLDALATGPEEHLRWSLAEDDEGAAHWQATNAQGELVASEEVPKRQAHRPPPLESVVHDTQREPIEALPETAHDIPASLFDDTHDAPHSDAAWWDAGAPHAEASSTASASELEGLALEDIEAPEALFDHAKPTSSTWWDEAEDDTEPLRAPVTNGAGPSRTPATDGPTPRAPAPVLDDSDFSDGYEEMQSAPAPVSSTDERSRQLALLGSLIGDTSDVPAPVSSAPALSDEEWDASRTEPVAEKEAVPAPDTHRNPDANKTTPTVPLDDRPQPAEAPAAHAEPPPSELAAKPDAATPNGASASRSDGSVPLKDMFQHDGTFTLFGGMAADGLDEFELEDPFAEAIEPAAPAPQPAPAPPTSLRFPSFTTPTTMGHDSLLDVLQQGGSQPFWCVDTDEQIEEHWKEHRTELTQLYKRMHREAVKKTKRRVAGARAGTGTTRLGAAASVAP
ncbi:hypothetical protein MBRA1_003844 [Malassezia brasiliensis]|uniref:RRM domain-containing protein n=1 Tax=Malassezia brasiliensis TaxID=1821822 RepID=A0AAF0DX74_9BASI|nr:hypothetical protein MBRA1_003844 [Malassezia brasiliensis]